MLVPDSYFSNPVVNKYVLELPRAKILASKLFILAGAGRAVATRCLYALGQHELKQAAPSLSRVIGLNSKYNPNGDSTYQTAIVCTLVYSIWL